MREFPIWLSSVREVEEFVALATTMSFPVMVNDGHHTVSGGSFMEMFCLDCSHPLTVTAQCSEEAFEGFRQAARRFWAQ